MFIKSAKPAGDLRCKGSAATLVASAVLFASFCLFLGCSIHLSLRIPQGQELGVLGFDYSSYQRLFSSLDSILYFPFRHPFFGVIFSPVILLGHVIRAYSANLYVFALCVCLSASVSLCVFISYKIQHDVLGLQPWEAVAGCLLFSSFAYMPILSTVPESFGFSMLALSLTLLLASRQLLLGQPSRASHWVALAFLAGGITISNVAKVGLAHLVANRLDKRTVRVVLLGGVAAAMLGTAGFYARMSHYNAAHPEAPKSVLHAIAQTCSWAHTDLAASERVSISASRFFCEPILFHSNALRDGPVPLRYRSWAPTVLAGALYALVALSIIVNIRAGFTWLVLSLFAVDALLHLAVFWDTVEGQIFCGHWFYLLPVLTAQLAPRLPSGPVRRTYGGVLIALAAGNFVHNFSLLSQAVF